MTATDTNLTAVNNLPSMVGRSSTEDMPKQSLDIMTFNGDGANRRSFSGADIGPNNIPTLQPGELAWLHFVGIEDNAKLRELLKPFGIHDLVIEDILSHKQRPKIEDYGHYLFVATRVFSYKKLKLQYNQVYLIIGPQFVLTFQAEPLGLFSIIRNYIQQNRFDIRHKPIDFFAYTFIDRIVDDYFVVLEQFNNRVESLDKELFMADNDNILVPIHQLKRDAMRLRRALLPQREMLHQLVRGDFEFFTAATHVYLRDVYDHSLQLMESLDGSRDMVMSMMDIHLSYQSNRLNKQMRVLTVITILFMPLTVITGIYGMNFDFMPELHWHYGYFAVLGCMALIIASLLLFFAKRRWL
ncbi:magnesium/cobalt transporter CorA [Snodgrassella sp. CFCC 13594]|uniref:magnesium/cobalt transporter CorA n=1 Tax=Snodgrassella sp. CFCC 13594 TaxID=1775559 RepID=UPI00082C3C35|nr:magnesium/cobalt transporter CorA [Snodgrassella sp. CFCC 13594]